MPLNKGDRVKFHPEKGHEKLLKNEYVVLEYFINVAKQKTVRVRNLETNEESYLDPDLLILV